MNTKYFISGKQHRHRGFTLVELLLVIAIIAVLASLGVGVMAQAQSDAAEAATRSRINVIQKILEIELENYEVRRSPIAFADIATMVRNSGLEQDRLVLHVKLIKRMLIADLIRAEMPDGSFIGGPNIGEYPTFTLRRFFQTQLGINDFDRVQVPATVAEWNTWAVRYLGTVPTADNWPPIKDTDPADGLIEDAAFRSELLYALLSRIDIDGVPATETLGQRAIVDTNGNGRNEIVDGWGEPIFLQWQQEIMTVDSPEEGIWERTTDDRDMCGLSCEHFFPNTGISVEGYTMPVLPTQIRPFLTSERLLQIDGFPIDFQQRAVQ